MNFKPSQRASNQQDEHYSRILLLNAKGLNIPLSPNEVDLGQMFPIRLTGDGLVPSFDTRLLTWKYNLPLEATLEIAGKQSQANFTHIQSIELLSRLGDSGRTLPPPYNLPTARRRH